jgi:hypothetical protein
LTIETALIGVAVRVTDAFLAVAYTEVGAALVIGTMIVFTTALAQARVAWSGIGQGVGAAVRVSSIGGNL